MLCPFVNEHTRFPGVDYGKYETDEIDYGSEALANIYKFRKNHKLDE